MQGWGGTLGGSGRLSVSPPRWRRLLLLGRARTFLLRPEATAERAAGAGALGLSLPLFLRELLPSPRPAGPSSGGPAAERGALGAAAAVPGGGAGLAASGRREGGGEGRRLAPLRAPPGEPRAGPVAGQPWGQRGAEPRGAERGLGASAEGGLR